ncbi:hypothetical protein B0H65DRAFT_539007 [Neurospora tetraspora]|uniref:Uncharacterized protein n=1 Tax=Neurospora tetraspora TaxID=94610 RepID=A0AAE0MUR3_9PEZI|nr:hypothetical protein B0H65DRAFT_539007 [Neurospora tetraspora]
MNISSVPDYLMPHFISPDHRSLIYVPQICLYGGHIAPLLLILCLSFRSSRLPLLIPPATCCSSTGRESLVEGIIDAYVSFTTLLINDIQFKSSHRAAAEPAVPAVPGIFKLGGLL